MSRAMSRYDAIAEWYDEVSTPWAEAEPDGSASWLTRLLGYGQGWCLDLACGAGRHAAAIEATGRTVVGLELAAGLRLERVEEFGGDLDHGHVPRNLALVAAKPPA
jgi:hypothetical protein